MGAVDFPVIVIEFHLATAFGAGICQRQDVAEILPGHCVLQPNVSRRIQFQLHRFSLPVEQNFHISKHIQPVTLGAVGIQLIPDEQDAGRGTHAGTQLLTVSARGDCLCDRSVLLAIVLRGHTRILRQCKAIPVATGRVGTVVHIELHGDATSVHRLLLSLLEIQVDLSLPACCQRAGRPHIADGVADGFVVHLGADGIAAVIRCIIFVNAEPGSFLRCVDVRAQEQKFPAKLLFLLDHPAHLLVVIAMAGIFHAVGGDHEQGLFGDVLLAGVLVDMLAIDVNSLLLE